MPSQIFFITDSWRGDFQVKVVTLSKSPDQVAFQGAAPPAVHSAKDCASYLFLEVANLSSV